MADLTRLDHLRGLLPHLREQIRGQDEVLGRIASVLQRAECGMADPGRPKGIFLFVGPTGVGKTETAGVFTRYLFDAAPVCFDLSEYQLQHSVDKLIGADPTDPGSLGRALEGVTRGTLLFDEVEKAHPLFLGLFLQILEGARITLATGATLDLHNFYVVFTSNIGAGEAMRMTHSSPASVERAVLARIEQTLRPELVGRIDHKLVFHRLGYEVQRDIGERLVLREVTRLRSLGFDLEVSREALEFLVREGHHPHLGARPMRKAIEHHVQDAVVRELFRTGSANGWLVANLKSSGLTVQPHHAKAPTKA